ncbi:YncE family protein [Kitasatospora purpeofusca]|uniref:YncE family protein n=1 Tax=Kitasatospora purpeofusca TaxID=67352 RepID=UPI003868C6B5|nr:hypothetical protein OIP63_38555 [Kitasatospora purpeofusca]
MNSLLPVARWVASLLAAALVAAGVLIGPGTVAAAAGPPSPEGGKSPVGGVERLVPLPGVAWAQRALISADGRRAYVGEETPTGSRIGVVDTRSGAVLAEVQTAPESWSGTKTFAPDGRSIYLLSAGTLNIFDTSTNTVRASVPLPEQPHPDGWRVGSPYSLALAPNGATVYAQTKPEGRIQVIDLTTDTLAATIDLNTGFRQVTGLAVNPRGSRLYVLIQTNLPSPTVAVYSTATNRPVPKEDFAEFDLEHGATLTVGPDGHTFYVTGTNYNDNPGTFLQIVSF